MQNAPETTALTFNEEINPNFAQVVVVSVDGEPRSVDVSTSGATVTASMPGGLAAGRITVRYRVVSKDGHPIEGEISFTAGTGPAGTLPGQATGSAPGGAADTQADSPEGASRSPAQEEGASFSPWGYPLVGSAALILIGIGVALRKRPRRHP